MMKSCEFYPSYCIRVHEQLPTNREEFELLHPTTEEYDSPFTFNNHLFYASEPTRNDNHVRSSVWIESCKEGLQNHSHVFRRWLTPSNKYGEYQLSLDANIYVITNENVIEFWTRYQEDELYETSQMSQMAQKIDEYEEALAQLSYLGDILDQHYHTFVSDIRDERGTGRFQQLLSKSSYKQAHYNLAKPMKLSKYCAIYKRCQHLIQWVDQFYDRHRYDILVKNNRGEYIAHKVGHNYDEEPDVHHVYLNHRLCVDYSKVKKDGYDGVYVHPLLMDNLDLFTGRQQIIREYFGGLRCPQFFIWNWCFVSRGDLNITRGYQLYDEWENIHTIFNDWLVKHSIDIDPGDINELFMCSRIKEVVMGIIQGRYHPSEMDECPPIQEIIKDVTDQITDPDFDDDIYTYHKIDEMGRIMRAKYPFDSRIGFMLDNMLFGVDATHMYPADGILDEHGIKSHIEAWGIWSVSIPRRYHTSNLN